MASPSSASTDSDPLGHIRMMGSGRDAGMESERTENEVVCEIKRRDL